jgi:hypothetical protein
LGPDKSKIQHSGLPVVEAADGHALNNDAKTHEGEATQSNFVLVVPVLLVEIWILPKNTQDCSVADLGCLSRIRIFSVPDPNFCHSGSRIRIKEFYKYFNPKTFLSSWEI